MCTGTHPFIPANNTAKLELIYLMSGQRCENVFWLRSDSGWNAGSLTALALSAIESWDTNVGGHTATAVELVLVRATDMAVDDGEGVEIEPTATTTGDLNENVLPGNVTVATKFATGFTGRSRRGRAYFVGLTEPMVTANALNGTNALDISAGWLNFFGDLTDGSHTPQHVIVSYCGGGVWRDEAVVTVVTNYTTDPNTDSMRRRLNGRGA